MAIRVTTLGTENTMLNYIWANQTKYNETSEQLSSGKKLNNIYDNAADAISVLNVNKQINQLNGYLDNMALASNELNVQDTSFSSTVSDLQRAHDLCTQAANGTTSTSSLANIKTEVDQIIKDLVSQGNTNYNGNYLFAGTNVLNAPFTQAADGSITYSGTPSTKQYQRYTQISSGVSVATNISGDQLYGTYDATTNTGSGIFGTLGQLSKALGTTPPDYNNIRSYLDKMQNNISSVSNARTQFASITSRFTMTKSSINNTMLQLKSYKSDLEDVDTAQASTDLYGEKTALQATMAVASAVMQQSNLLSYIS